MPPKNTAADEALRRSQARAEFRKEFVSAGADAQVKIAREKGRQRRSVEKVKTKQRVIERQQSETARVASAAQRSAIVQSQNEQRRVQRVQTQRDLNALKQDSQPGFVSNAAGSIGGSVTGSSAWSTLVTLTTLFFIIIIAYLIVTNGQQFGSFTGKAGSFIQTLSSTKPIFVSSG